MGYYSTGMEQNAIIDLRAAAARLLLLTVVAAALGCASTPPPASKALSDGEAAVRYDDLTVQALVIVYSENLWRGMISEPKTEDEQRGLYVANDESSQQEFVAQVQAALGIAVPAVDFRDNWIEDWKGPVGARTERGQRTERVPHLKVLLVETMIQHVGTTYDLSVVAVPSDPTQSGDPLVIFDDYVVKDVELWFENEISGDVKATVARFVIDRNEYPPGSRHYEYTRTIGNWSGPATRRVTTDEMLSEMRRHLVRDGFLNR